MAVSEISYEFRIVRAKKMWILLIVHLVLGCTGSSLLHGAFSLVVVQWASHCSDFLCDSQAPGHVGSFVTLTLKDTHAQYLWLPD